MKQLSAEELLMEWENSLPLPLIDRSLNLLSRLTGAGYATVARWSVGERDALLLEFREWLFGEKLLNLSACPSCGTQVEWEIQIPDIRAHSPVPEPGTRRFQHQSGPYLIDFRLPDSLDMKDALFSPEKMADPLKTVARCIVGAGKSGTETDPAALPPEILEEIGDRMGEEDPLSLITMELHCPSCYKQWEATFDIMHYLWKEIDSWAQKMLRDVASLAKAFGWSEKEILRMTPSRRNLYLDIVTDG